MMASRSRLLVWQRPVRGTEFHTSGTSRRCLHQPWKLVDKQNRHLPSARLQRRLLQLLLKQCQRNIRAATFGAISFRSRGVNGTSTHPRVPAPTATKHGTAPPCRTLETAVQSTGIGRLCTHSRSAMTSVDWLRSTKKLQRCSH